MGNNNFLEAKNKKTDMLPSTKNLEVWVHSPSLGYEINQSGVKRYLTTCYFCIKNTKGFYVRVGSKKVSEIGKLKLAFWARK